MLKFPTEAIKATEARYSAQSGPFGHASISVGLAPFQFDTETHETSLRCDQVELNLDDFPALAGKTFEFPLNPEPGYIDGSLYLFGVHVVFLTKSLSFGQIGEETIPLRIDGTLEFSSSGLPEYEDVVLTLETTLPLPLTTAQLTTMAAQAISETAAQSPRDIGKVMGVLAKERGANGRMADLHAEVRRMLHEREASTKATP